MPYNIIHGKMAKGKKGFDLFLVSLFRGDWSSIGSSFFVIPIQYGAKIN
jgi:hypothetical protein